MLETSRSVVDLERVMLPPAKEPVMAPVTHRRAAVPRSRGIALLQGAIIVPLLLLATVLMVFSLVPGIVLGLLLLTLPLAPLIVLGLGILAAIELEASSEDRLCLPDQPCCCGRHDEEFLELGGKPNI